MGLDKVGPHQSLPTTPVLPVGVKGAVSTNDDRWVFDVQPSHPMPVLDLGRTLKSELFPLWLCRVFDVIRRHPLALLLAYFVTTFSYIITLVVPASAGRFIALIGVLVGLPGNLITLGQLRYDIVKVLFKTFDVWFSSILWLIIFVVLALMLHDLRGIIVLSFWLGSWPNVCHDACLVTIRPIVIFNIICIVASAVIVVCVNFGLIDGMHDFDVLWYQEHSVPARSFISDGFVTVVALMSRNVYRRRAIVLRRVSTNELYCVVYRCQLKLIPRSHELVVGPRLQHSSSVLRSVSGDQRHIQQMRVAPSILSVDARNTLLPWAFSLLVQRHPRLGFVTPVAATTAVLATLASSSWLVSAAVAERFLDLSISTAWLLTVMNTGATVALYQREIVNSIYTSFDFLVMMLETTFVHICVFASICSYGGLAPYSSRSAHGFGSTGSCYSMH